MSALEARVAQIGPPAWCGLCADGKAPWPLDPARPGAARCAAPLTLGASGDAAFVALAEAYWDEVGKRLACAEWSTSGEPGDE